MGRKYIKIEDGKEVVYEEDIFVDKRIGELHETWDGSKETITILGPDVRVERQDTSSIERKGEVGGQQGTFKKGFLDNRPTFYPDPTEESSSTPDSYSDSEEEGIIGAFIRGFTESADGSTSYRSGENSKVKGSSGSGLGLLVKGTVTAVFLGALYFYVLDVRGERLQRPDTAVALVPSPAIPGDPYYTFDITSSSNNKGVLRITYSGNLLRRERTYAIDREKYPEVYRSLDINKDGEVSFEEFMEHASIFTNQKIAEGIREGDIGSLVDKILKATTQTIKN